MTRIRTTGDIKVLKYSKYRELLEKIEKLEKENAELKEKVSQFWRVSHSESLISDLIPQKSEKFRQFRNKKVSGTSNYFWMFLGSNRPVSIWVIRFAWNFFGEIFSKKWYHVTQKPMHFHLSLVRKKSSSEKL